MPLSVGCGRMDVGQGSGPGSPGGGGGAEEGEEEWEERNRGGYQRIYPMMPMPTDPRNGQAPGGGSNGPPDYDALLALAHEIEDRFFGGR
jgi:hypothetical protein